MNVGRRVIGAALLAGRRWLRNTPIQRFRIVTWVYRRLFAHVHPPDRDLHVRYLGAEYVVPAGDVTIAPSLIAGDYERAEFEALGRLLGSGATVVDVGANVGLHAVFCGMRVGPNGRVIALEPEPTNYTYLVENVRRNGLANVETCRHGAGARAGALRLHLVPGGHGGHSAAALEGSVPIEVEIVRLDDFLRDRVRRVDLVKIDVEYLIRESHRHQKYLWYNT
jgi:FkbM family methyltransferase